MNEKDRKLAQGLAIHAIVATGYLAYLPSDNDPLDSMSHAADDYFVHEDFDAGVAGERMWQDRRHEIILLAFEEVYAFARQFEEGHRVVGFAWDGE